MKKIVLLSLLLAGCAGPMQQVNVPTMSFERQNDPCTAKIGYQRLAVSGNIAEIRVQLARMNEELANTIVSMSLACSEAEGIKKAYANHRSWYTGDINAYTEVKKKYDRLKNMVAGLIKLIEQLDRPSADDEANLQYLKQLSKELN